MPILEGRIALISGAGRGIGRATAVAFSREGASLLLLARTLDQLKETAALCEDGDGEVVTLSVDLLDTDAISDAIGTARRTFPTIDILINNAAMFDSGIMAEYTSDRFEAMFKTNVLAPFCLAKAVIPMMKAQGGGTIVNISSYSGCFGVEKFPGFGAYNITKYALWGLTEILAIENKSFGIRVNQVSPSGVDTQMFREAVPPGVLPDLSPENVASKILFLASDDSAPLTGSNILIPEPEG